MAKGGRVGGQGGPAKRGAWMFVAACIAVAIWGGALSDPAGLLTNLKNKSAELQQTAHDVVAFLGLTEDGSIPQFTGPTIPVIGTGGGGGADSGLGQLTNGTLDRLPVAAPQTVAYNRDEWQHWDNVGSSCWNVREEVLLRDAEPNSVTLLNRDKQPTTDKASACYVAGGTWIDPYTGQTFTNPDDLDIDHLVPLGEAARSGGQAWSSDRKRAYANDLLDPTHLLAVSSSANRAKSDQTPAAWRPANQAFWCEYAVAYTGVKSRWGLTVATDEQAALRDMLATC